MNKTQADILLACARHPDSSQRALAQITGSALGQVNKVLKSLAGDEYISDNGQLLPKAVSLIAQNQPKSAVILAAGYGMRMVPINTEIPKGLLEVQGEPLIERQITQLHEAGVQDIYIVVGYLKEQYEYLIDQYGVKLIVNMDYADKNNLISLEKAAAHISNTYIVPCDLWSRENPFSSQELYSWYMVSDRPDKKSSLRINRKGEFAPASHSHPGCRMIGISYIQQDFAEDFKKVLADMADNEEYAQDFWESAMLKTQAPLYPKRVQDEEVVEINTYEQLRDLDENSNQLNSPAISTICEAFCVQPEEITNIRVLKKGMTNRSFLFEIDHKHYIMRIPGEGTDQLINRKEEADVYRAIAPLGLCDDIIYINPDNGFKITRFMENTHNCDPENWEEISRCMAVLKSFHEKKLQVNHDFDLFGQIEFYESLLPGRSVYRDYGKTRELVMSLKPWIDSLPKEKTLCHIDSVCDNFLIDEHGDIRLIDWEYAGMQDPHLDLAMNCIYAMYDKEQIDRLIDTYFQSEVPALTRLKIYAYIAAAGLLWSNWCEYKASMGLEFGEYALRQYRYAKEFGRLVHKELEEKNHDTSR